MTGVLIRDKTGKDAKAQEKPCEGVGRAWSGVATRQEMHGGTRSWKKQERFSPTASGGSRALPILDFILLAFRIGKG